MSATKITEHSSHITEGGKEKLLKVAAIYGGNAVGKSNIYGAFKYMTYYVLRSFLFGGEGEMNKAREQEYTKVSPFMFDKTSKVEPTTFEVFFMDNGDTTGKSYQYGFCINSEEVLEEWLFYKAKTGREYKTVFYRKKGAGTDYWGIKKGADNIEISLEKETLIVSLGAKPKIKELKLVRDWFFKNEVVDFGDPIENLMCSSTVPRRFVENLFQPLIEVDLL